MLSSSAEKVGIVLHWHDNEKKLHLVGCGESATEYPNLAVKKTPTGSGDIAPGSGWFPRGLDMAIAGLRPTYDGLMSLSFFFARWELYQRPWNSLYSLCICAWEAHNIPGNCGWASQIAVLFVRLNSSTHQCRVISAYFSRARSSLPLLTSLFGNQNRQVL